MPQCYSCANWERDTERCLIHGELDDCRGCCVSFERIVIKNCLRAPVIRINNGRIFCELCDTVGCEACYDAWLRASERRE